MNNINSRLLFKEKIKFKNVNLENDDNFEIFDTYFIVLPM